MLTRRRLAAGVATVLSGAAQAAGAVEWPATLAQDFARLEARAGGRLGVAVLDTGSGSRAGHRAGERFPLCSTFKLLAAAAVLARVDAGQERLDRRVVFGAEALVPYSPWIERQVGPPGMTLEAICEAAMVVSDNTAGNLLLDVLGGPEGLTASLRALGDPVTRLDRREPALNEALPGDPRDTTTPDAMLGRLRALVLGDALAPPSRALLTGWLLGNRTGDTRLRAGVSADWRVGEKTGTGQRGSTNDVGVLWPPGRAPILVAAYLTGSPAPAEDRNATVAAVARLVAATQE